MVLGCFCRRGRFVWCKGVDFCPLFLLQMASYVIHEELEYTVTVCFLVIF